ncbi:hypothetical protein BGZ91_006607 [Linnemannia elongata]|nr:hypothetical protein BGZ91_006607 [Linnemannia elongata]
MEKHEVTYASSVTSDKESIVDLRAERPEQGSNFLAYANVVCVVAGTGTLGLPYALQLGGWIGVGILLLSLLMSVYTAILLMRCLYYNGKYRLSSYQEIGRHAYGLPGLVAVWFFHTSIVLGAPIMYLILAGTEVHSLVNSSAISEKAWIWICAAIVAVPFVAMKTLKEVAVMSVFGALATVVLVIVAVRGSIIDMQNHNPEYATITHNNVVLANLPTTIASISICFGGNVVYMHVEEAMRYPKSWNRVVAAALATCSFERLTDVTVARRGKVMERVYRSIIRLVVIGICGGIACTVPFFGDFLSLLGALGNCSLIFVLPIIFYFKLIGWRQMKAYELVWCAFIVIIGVISAVIGSIDAIKALRNDFINQK